jgi:anaerobic ribonucleoside-triphosphate reductase activating protein
MVTYDKYDIVFQEIPNEVSLAFTLKGCPNKCAGCHSTHLRDNNGHKLTIDSLRIILEKYKDSITTVLFLGGDANHNELIPLFKEIRKHGLKSAFYSGFDYFNISLLNYLDYYKAGRYIRDLGGLNSKTTNQRISEIRDGKIIDITRKFWK